MSRNNASIAAEKTKLHQTNEARSFKANGKTEKPMQKASQLLTNLINKGNNHAKH